MKAEKASVWEKSHREMVAAVDAEINPEAQIGDREFLSEVLENYFYGNIYPEELSQVEAHAKHVKLLQPIIDSINERVADLDYYRDLLQEYRIESTGVVSFVERISFELQKRKKYEQIKEQYIQAHKDLLELRSELRNQIEQTPDLPVPNIESDTEGNQAVLTKEELYEALWASPEDNLEIEQRTGNCYYIATQLSLHAKPELAKEVLGLLVDEIQPGVFSVAFPGLPERIEVTIHDILRYAAASKIANTKNLGDTILEVAFNEYHERVPAGFFHADMELGSRRFTEMENATEGGDPAEPMEALLGKEIAGNTLLLANKDEALEYLSNLDPKRTMIIFNSQQSLQFIPAIKKKSEVSELTKSEQAVLDKPGINYYPVVDFEGNERPLLGEHAYAMIAIDQQSQTVTLQNPGLKDDVITLDFETVISSFLSMSHATVPRTSH